MNDDYLWDGTGEPDPEIQRLEQTLRPVAYQARALKIPATVSRQGKRSWIPSLAIAATIAMMVFGVALWMARQNDRAKESSVNHTPATASDPNPESMGSVETKAKEEVSGINSSVAEDKTPTSQPRRHTPRYRAGGVTNSTLARRSTRDRDVNTTELSAEEIAEAKQAKEQLFLALRLASSKLNLAQKKAQAYPTNLIRNQHKVG